MKSMHTKGILLAFALAVVVAGFLQHNVPTQAEMKDPLQEHSEIRWL